jgi:hypothetical protein
MNGIRVAIKSGRQFASPLKNHEGKEDESQQNST